MQQRQQHKEDSLQRVQSFLDAHADVLGVLKATPARTQLDNAVTQLAGSALNQGTTGLQATGQTSKLRQLEEDLKTNHMAPMAKFARANLRGVPDFSALTKSTRNVRGKALVAEARAMATAAQPYAAQFTQAQFPADTVQQLGTAADTLDAAITAQSDTKVQRVVATAGVKNQLALGREAVEMLDPIVSKLLANTPELLAGWRSAKRVTAKSGGAGAAVASVPATTPVAAAAPAQPVTVGAIAPTVVAAVVPAAAGAAGSPSTSSEPVAKAA